MQFERFHGQTISSNTSERMNNNKHPMSLFDIGTLQEESSSALPKEINQAYDKVTKLLSTYFYPISPHIWSPPSVFLRLRHCLEELESVLFQISKCSGMSVCTSMILHGLGDTLKEIELLLMGQRVDIEGNDEKWWEKFHEVGARGGWESYLRAIRKVRFFLWAGRLVSRVLLGVVPETCDGESGRKTEEVIASLLRQYMELYEGEENGVDIFGRFEELGKYDGDCFINKVRIHGVLRVWMTWTHKAISGLRNIENDQAVPAQYFLDLLKVGWIYHLLRNNGRFVSMPSDLKAVMLEVCSELIITVKGLVEQRLPAPDVSELVQQGEWKILLDEGFEDEELEVVVVDENVKTRPESEYLLPAGIQLSLEKKENITTQTNPDLIGQGKTRKEERLSIDEKIPIEEDMQWPSHSASVYLSLIQPLRINTSASSSSANSTPKSGPSPSSSISYPSDFELPAKNKEEKEETTTRSVNRMTTVPIALDINSVQKDPSSVVISPLYETYKEIQATLAKQRDSSFEDMSPVNFEKSSEASTPTRRIRDAEVPSEIQELDAYRQIEPNDSQIPRVNLPTAAAKHAVAARPLRTNKDGSQAAKDKELPPIPGQSLEFAGALTPEKLTDSESDEAPNAVTSQRTTRSKIGEPSYVETTNTTENKPKLLLHRATMKSAGTPSIGSASTDKKIITQYEKIRNEKPQDNFTKDPPSLPQPQLFPMKSPPAGGPGENSVSAAINDRGSQNIITRQAELRSNARAGTPEEEVLPPRQAAQRPSVRFIEHERNVSTPPLFRAPLAPGAAVVTLAENNKVLKEKVRKKLHKRSKSAAALSVSQRELTGIAENRGQMEHLEEPQSRDGGGSRMKRGRSRDGKSSRFIRLREIATEKAAEYGARPGEFEVAPEKFATINVYASETGLMAGRWEPVVIRLFRDADEGISRIVTFRLDGSVTQVSVDSSVSELVPEWAYHNNETVPLLYIRRISESADDNRDNNRRDSNRSSFGCVGVISVVGYGRAISPFWRFKKQDDLFAFQSAWTGEVVHTDIPLISSIKYSVKRGLIPHEHTQLNGRVQFWTNAADTNCENTRVGNERRKEPFTRIMMFFDEMIMTIFATDNIELEPKGSGKFLRIKPATNRSRSASGSSSVRVKMIGKDVNTKNTGLASTTCGGFRLDKEGLDPDDEQTGAFKDFQWVELEFCNLDDMKLFYQAFASALKERRKEIRPAEMQLQQLVQLQQGSVNSANQYTPSASSRSRVNSHSDAFTPSISSSLRSSSRASSRPGTSSASNIEFNSFGGKSGKQHEEVIDEKDGEEAEEVEEEVEIDAAEMLLGITPAAKKKKKSAKAKKSIGGTWQKLV